LGAAAPRTTPQLCIRPARQRQPPRRGRLDGFRQALLARQRTDHLEFLLKHEAADLVLKHIFDASPVGESRGWCGSRSAIASRDNLLGTGRYSPTIRRTPALEQALASELSASARETVGRTGSYLVARAASFLLLADHRASF
jgi:hypothetical protein